jgi:hypothetical protein
MARYDSPGFTDVIPGGVVNESTGAPGSPGAPGVPVPPPGAVYAAGTEGPAAALLPEGTVMVSNWAGGPSVTAEWGRDDTQVPAQTDLYAGQDANALSGQAGGAVGQTGAGTGAWHPSNPNAVPVGSLADQLQAARR